MADTNTTNISKSLIYKSLEYTTNESSFYLFTSDGEDFKYEFDISDEGSTRIKFTIDNKKIIKLKGFLAPLNF